MRTLPFGSQVYGAVGVILLLFPELPSGVLLLPVLAVPRGAQEDVGEGPAGRQEGPDVCPANHEVEADTHAHMRARGCRESPLCVYSLAVRELVPWGHRSRVTVVTDVLKECCVKWNRHVHILPRGRRSRGSKACAAGARLTAFHVEIERQFPICQLSWHAHGRPLESPSVASTPLEVWRRCLFRTMRTGGYQTVAVPLLRSRRSALTVSSSICCYSAGR